MEITLIFAVIFFILPFLIWATLNIVKPDRIFNWSFSKWRVIGISLLLFIGLGLIMLGLGPY